MKNAIVAGLCCAAASLSLHATTVDFGDGLTNLSLSRVLLNANGQAGHWSGVGRIRSTTGSSCTATLLDTRSPDSPPDASAYVLTNGHCIDKQNGLILTDKEIEGSIQFNFFTDSVPRTYPLKRINWSSVQGVDLSVIELEPTLQSLVDQGIQPLRLASQMPEEGHDVLWVGAPLYKDTGHLRMAACSHVRSDVILEQPWVWRHTFSNQCRDVDTGASGSPVLTRDRQQIIGVLNFTNQPAASEREEEDQEVLEELAPGFPPLTPDSNFGSPVPWLNDCFISGVFSTQPEHCSLFPRFSVEFKNTPERYAKVRLDSEGKHVYPGWNLRFSVDKPRYRYKKADRPLDCEDPAGYSGTRAAQEATITEPIDGPIGINWLCIVGVDAAEEQPSAGLMRNALTLAVELQPAGPTAAPLMSIEQKPSGTYAVRWQYDAGLIDHYTVKMGPPDATDCSDPQGFTRRPGDSLLVTARSLPRKICTCAHDVNGQPSAVREDLLVESVAQ